MSESTKIEWTDATWNPITGCSVVSPGCKRCYAMKLAGGRLRHHPTRAGLTVPSKAGPVWTGEVRFNESMLFYPFRWSKPRRIFVCAHGDLFAEGVPDEWIDRVFAVMALCPQHIFQVLTKRPERMREYIVEKWQPAPARTYHLGGDTFDMPAEEEGETRRDQVERQASEIGENNGLIDVDNEDHWTAEGNAKALAFAWPLPNVWLGVSAEDQQRADERIPPLLATPAAKRFVSLEPLLGPIDLTQIDDGAAHREVPREEWGPVDDDDSPPSLWWNALTGERTIMHGGAAYCDWSRFDETLDWVIVGGESGTGARPMSVDWVRSLRDQCQLANVPFFFKQWGAWIDADHRLDAIERGGAFVLKQGKPWQPPQPLSFADADYLAQAFDTPIEHHSDGTSSILVSKRAAGRLLDGVEHNGMPP